MKRILVVGPSGAGKSYFSRHLGEILKIEVNHLDNLFWRSDRTHLSKEEFDEKLASLLKKDQWIIDGDYSRTYEMRFRACDTIFFINLTLKECLDGVQSRIGQDRPDIPWTETSLDPEFREWIIRWFDTTLPVLKEMLDRYRSTRTIITFNSRKEADEYLARLTKKRSRYELTPIHWSGS